jgi:general secretion pathway protein A
VVVAPEPEPEVSLDAQLQVAGDLTNKEAALITLLQRWGLEYRSDATGCSQAAAAGYECLFQRGSWSGLRQYDRPAVLTLIDHQGATHNVVLTAIEGEMAELSIGGVTVTHELADVSDMWFGQYMLLWRPPNGASMALGPGSRGANVVWLRQSLAAIDDRYQTTAANSNIFDAELQEQVRAFQRDHRLSVDGLAGHQTQIIINTLLAPDNTPRLTVPRLAQE